MAIAPEPVLRGALHVLYWAAVHNRNWTYMETFTVERTRALWDALHNVPDLLTRWRDDAETELINYFDIYDQQFDDLHLRTRYEQAKAGGASA